MKKSCHRHNVLSIIENYLKMDYLYHLNSRRIYRRNVFFRIEFVLYNFSRRSSSIARRLATMRARERCEMSSEEFVFQLSPAPVTFRWTLIKVPVFLVDQVRPRSIESIAATKQIVQTCGQIRERGPAAISSAINVESRLPRIDYPASVRLDAHEYERKQREFRIFLLLSATCLDDKNGFFIEVSNL